MRPKVWFYSWEGGYNQVLALADKLNGRIILRENSNYKYNQGDIVINWGSSTRPTVLREVRVLNEFEKVGNGKRADWIQLMMKGIQVPQFTDSMEVANAWLEHGRVLGRDRDHGMGGEGIKVYQKGERVNQHKFYVKYVKKEREFRYHVFQGKVIFVQEKLRKKGAENVDRYIRSHNRGWCFAFKHLNENPPPNGGDIIACNSIDVLRLDFGAVDIGWSNKLSYTVLEVNTAPGIENSSFNSYVEALSHGRF